MQAAFKVYNIAMRTPGKGELTMVELRVRLVGSCCWHQIWNLSFLSSERCSTCRNAASWSAVARHYVMQVLTWSCWCFTQEFLHKAGLNEKNVVTVLSGLKEVRNSGMLLYASVCTHVICSELCVCHAHYPTLTSAHGCLPGNIPWTCPSPSALCIAGAWQRRAGNAVIPGVPACVPLAGIHGGGAGCHAAAVSMTTDTGSASSSIRFEANLEASELA